MQQNSEQNQTKTNLVNNLLSLDEPNHLLSNFTAIYVGYINSEESTCLEQRRSKSETFLTITQFLGGLINIKKN